MNKFKYLLLIIVLPLFAFTAAHKYYVSVTEVEYAKEQKSVQIITRIFIDDFENLLQQRYDETIILTENDDAKQVDTYIDRYLTEKIKIKINDVEATIKFLGKKYDSDIVKCYLEIENVESINSFQISNKILFDLFDDQQNIVKTKINSKQKSFLLIPQNFKVLLNFN